MPEEIRTMRDWLNAYARICGLGRPLTDEEVERGLEWLDELPGWWLEESGYT